MIAGIRYTFSFRRHPSCKPPCHRSNFFDIPCIRMLFNLIAASKINFNARLHRITCSLATPCCTNFSSACGVHVHTCIPLPDMLHGIESHLAFNIQLFILCDGRMVCFYVLKKFFCFSFACFFFFLFLFVFRVSRLKWMGNGRAKFVPGNNSDQSRVFQGL